MLRSPQPLAVLLGELPGLTRLALAKLLAAIPHVRVVGAATAGADMVRLALSLRPDVIIAGEAALPALAQLARHTTIPVLLYTATTPLPGMLREVARRGVYSYICPVVAGGALGEEQLPELTRKLAVAAMPRLVPTSLVAAGVSAPPRGLVILGGSTGGASAVERVIQGLLPTMRQAVVVAVHLPSHFTKSLVDRLRRVSALPIAAAGASSRLEAGKILVVPGGCNMVVRPVSASPWMAWQTEFAQEQPTAFDVPSVDMLMTSAARAMGRKVMGVVLSGLGSDGTLGAHAVRQLGGVVIAQNEASAAVFSMPKSVIQAGLASHILPLQEIAGFINHHGPQALVPRANRYSLSQAATS